jgi:hypothetical protein
MENTPSPELLFLFHQLNSWRTTRESEYGHVNKQLNLLWDDIDNGLFGEEAKTGQWYQFVKTIKENNPKPDNLDEIKLQIDNYIKETNSMEQ